MKVVPSNHVAIGLTEDDSPGKEIKFMKWKQKFVRAYCGDDNVARSFLKLTATGTIGSLRRDTSTHDITKTY